MKEVLSRPGITDVDEKGRGLPEVPDSTSIVLSRCVDTTVQNTGAFPRGERAAQIYLRSNTSAHPFTEDSQ